MNMLKIKMKKKSLSKETECLNIEIEKIKANQMETSEPK